MCELCEVVKGKKTKQQIFWNNLFRVVIDEDLSLPVILSNFHTLEWSVHQEIRLSVFKEMLFGQQAILKDGKNEKYPREHKHTHVVGSKWWHPCHPRFSVITPCRSRDVKYLKMMLRSMRYQGYVDYEHIIIEDGKEGDEVSKVVQEHRDRFYNPERIRYL